eukprot:gene5777-9598_t
MKKSALREKLDEKYRYFLNNYEIIGKIGEGAYGSVQKAYSKNTSKIVAIKTFHPKISREGEGISQTIIREISLLKDSNHENLVNCLEVYFHQENNSYDIIMVFEYVQFELEQLIKYHINRIEVFDERNKVRKNLHSKMDKLTIKSFIFQILKGVEYLHQNFIIHRDLKPANIMVLDDKDSDQRGLLKIIDFGLARKIQDPIRNLSDDGPVVTIWYRAPEVILGAKHYTPAIDIWSVGCIFGELLTGLPLFNGKEIKMEGDNNPFQEYQMEIISTVLGCPSVESWNSLKSLPQYHQISKFTKYSKNLLSEKVKLDPNSEVFDLLQKMLIYDPEKRITATESLSHSFFKEDPKPVRYPFQNLNYTYPIKKPSNEKRKHNSFSHSDSKRMK